MLKEKMQALLLKKNGENNKKTIENLVVFILILIITVISINAIWNKDNKEKEKKESTYTKLANTTDSNSSVTQTEDNLEQRLGEILQKIDGVGNVNVLITYSSSSEVIPMYNENSKNSSTKEEDSGGGTRTVEETDTSKEIVYTEENGKNIPVTKQVVSPKIEGAIITANGAGNAIVKTNIIQAVEAATGLASHKIQVFEMQK